MSVEQDLINAIRKQDIQAIKNAIQNGANVNHKLSYFYVPSAEYQVPMYEAAKSNNIEIMSLLKDAGADINLQDASKKFPLYIAIDAGADDVARWLIDEGANIHLKDHRDHTVMYVAVERGNIDMCKFLIDKGASIDLKDGFDRTLIHVAADKGSIDMCKFLMEKGIDIHAKAQITDLGITPAQIAARNANLDLVKWFESQGVDVLELNTYPNLASYAAQANATEVLEWLIGRGVDVNDINIFKEAVYRMSFDVLRLLISYGADINQEIEEGKSAMARALQYPNHYDYYTVLNLLSLGADLKIDELCNLLLKPSFHMTFNVGGYNKIFDEAHILAGLNILRSIDNLQSKGSMILREGSRSTDVSQAVQNAADTFAKTLADRIEDLVEYMPSGDALTIKEIAQKQAEYKNLISKYPHISKELLNRYALEDPLDKFIKVADCLENNKLERVSNAFLNAPVSFSAVSEAFIIKEVTRSIGSHLNPDDQTALTEAWPEVKVTPNGLSAFDQDVTDHPVDLS